MTERAKEVLQILMEGNRRFAGSLLLHPHQDAKRRMECVSGQQPIAAIVGCSDSRIPPEVIFDCGIGDIFIIRVAGTVLDNAATASIEYAVDHLKVPLVMVLGHTSCGAVTAAVQNVKTDGALGKMLDEIRNDCSSIKNEDLTTIIKQYTVQTAQKLNGMQPIVQPAVENGLCSIVPAFYSLESGVVELLEK
jgi:carbonic anhydrase